MVEMVLGIVIVMTLTTAQLMTGAETTAHLPGTIVMGMSIMTENDTTGEEEEEGRILEGRERM